MVLQGSSNKITCQFFYHVRYAVDYVTVDIFNHHGEKPKVHKPWIVFHYVAQLGPML